MARYPYAARRGAGAVNGAVSKTVKGASSSRVQIPPPPLNTRLEPAWLSHFGDARSAMPIRHANTASCLA